MAALNLTQVNVGIAVAGFMLSEGLAFQYEKISCWNGTLLEVEPLALFGKRIRVGEHTQGIYDADGYVHESVFYEAKVVAVQLGSVEDGIETSLLLRQDGMEPDYVNVSSLTVLEVFE